MSRHPRSLADEEVAGAPEGASGIFLGIPHHRWGRGLVLALLGGLTALAALYLVLQSAS